MSNTAIPRTLGDDYQARFFWTRVSRLFLGHTRVVKVGFELNEVKAFDDVAVYYGTPVPDGQGGFHTAEYFQVKFHVAQNGVFTCRSLMDPDFINATSVSLLQRLQQAQRTYAPDGTGALFWIVAPWPIDHNDLLGTLVSNHNRAIRLDQFFDGTGPRSATGQVRREWRQHLGLANDDDLRRVLRPLRIWAGAPALDQMREIVNDQLLIAGLHPAPTDERSCVYDDLIWKLRQAGQHSFTRAEVEAIARSESLWRGTPTGIGAASRIGVRSFLRFAEHMDDDTEDMHCLLRHFDRRTIRNSSLWNTAIFPELSEFLNRVRKGRAELGLLLDAHSTIAFAAGYVLDTKCGLNVIPLQRTRTGLTSWPATPGDSTLSLLDWVISTEELTSASQDCALVLSATHDILPDARLYIQQHLPTVSRIVSGVLPPAPSTTSVTGGLHALNLAESACRYVRQLRTLEERRGVLHLFNSAPNALVFRLGQQAQVLGRCQLYEYDFDSGLPGAYIPSLAFPIAFQS